MQMWSSMSRKLHQGAFVAAFFAGVAVAAVPTVALGKSPIACGTLYTIQRGDTLFKIARRAYADGHQFDRIYEANRDFLPNEASVEMGDQLLIPCPDGSGPDTRREAIAQGILESAEGIGSSGQSGETVALEPATEPALATMPRLLPPPVADEPVRERGNLLQKAVELAYAAALPGSFVANPAAPESLLTRMYPDPARTSETETDTPDPVAEATPHARIRFLAGSDASPYARNELPHGGMITELITRAVDAAAPDQAFRITFVANDSTHLAELLTDGAFDVGFPWYKPDCRAPDLDPMIAV